jgi:hypothetical protein
MTKATGDKVFEWKEEDGGITIQKFKDASALRAYLGTGTAAASVRAADDGAADTLVFKEINGKPVKKIDEGAFDPESGAASLADANVKKIALPETITGIAATAFKGAGLGELEIPPAVLDVLERIIQEIIAQYVPIIPVAGPNDVVGGLFATQGAEGIEFTVNSSKIPEGTVSINCSVYGVYNGAMWLWVDDKEKVIANMRPYPFVQADKTYSFYIGYVDERGHVFKRSAPVTLTAASGLGELKVANAEKNQVIYEGGTTVKLRENPKLPELTSASITGSYIFYNVWEDEDFTIGVGIGDGVADVTTNEYAEVSLETPRWGNPGDFIDKSVFASVGYMLIYKTASGEEYEYETDLAARSERFTFPTIPHTAFSGTLGSVTLNGTPYTGNLVVRGAYGDENDRRWIGEATTTPDGSWIIRSAPPLAVDGTIHFWIVANETDFDWIEGAEVPVTAGANTYSGISLGNQNNTVTTLSGTIGSITLNGQPATGEILLDIGLDSDGGWDYVAGVPIKANSTWTVNTSRITKPGNLTFWLRINEESCPNMTVTQSVSANGGTVSGINLGNAVYNLSTISG